ncbi:hypothetical protein QFC22_001600 [Naganishia vaughanmartiniae]|uniref:Uncharacterized protein n=1 Tax=Naganishia vaughanmartiniae TaxID=1424756 RepID=A0ACC2XHA5_9TREE|nr:hypothetical protein QFC22_001600 [Naganishia vaughanmartiniae]
MAATNDGFHPYQQHQSGPMVPYIVYPSNGLPTHSSSGASLSTSSSGNSNMNYQYFVVHPHMEVIPNWQQNAANIPRYLQHPSVKREPMDVDPGAPASAVSHPLMHQVHQQFQPDNHHPSATIYTGRFDMQGHVPTQVPVSQQRGYPSLGMNQMMQRNPVPPYAWHDQQRYAQQAAIQHARPTAMLNRDNIRHDPGSATIALQDVVQQRGHPTAFDDTVPEGSRSPDQVALPASVSIVNARPTTPFRPTTTSFGSTTLLYDAASACPTIAMGMIGGGGAHFATARVDTSSSPLSSCSSWRTDSGESMVDVKPPVGLSLRDVQGSSETNSPPYYYSLQNLADSEDDSDSDDSDSDEDSDEDEDDLSSDSDEDKDAEGDKDEGNDDDGEDMPTTTIEFGPVKSLPEASPAVSNVRSEPIKNATQTEANVSKITLSPRFIPSDFQRASARVARQRIADTADPIKSRSINISSSTTSAYKSKGIKAKKSTAKIKRSAKPRAKASVKKIKAKPRKPLMVTSGATCRVPNPIPNFEINKKSRGRAVTTDPNAIDSNVVHVCPVPACGACFKRREHVKRHIRGLHTEDKYSGKSMTQESKNRLHGLLLYFYALSLAASPHRKEVDVRQGRSSILEGLI